MVYYVGMGDRSTPVTSLRLSKQTRNRIRKVSPDSSMGDFIRSAVEAELDRIEAKKDNRTT